MIELYSECCDAPPYNEVDGNLLGICSRCKDPSLFYSDDPGEDWIDELEYMVDQL